MPIVLLVLLTSVVSSSVLSEIRVKGEIEKNIAGASQNEIIAQRTETSKTYQNSDGTRTLVSFGGVAHYKENYADPNALWQDIDAEHAIETPEYTLYDRLPSTVKVFKDKVGYEIESRKTGKKFTVELQTPQELVKITPTKLDKTIGLKNILDSMIGTAGALEPEPVKFEFEVSENGVRLWKTIRGENAPKDFTWRVTEEGEGSDLQFRENPEAFEVGRQDKQINIATEKTLIDDNAFLWTETAPQTDLKIDTDVTYNPDPDAEVNSVDGYAGRTKASPPWLTWATVRDDAGNTNNDTAASGDYIRLAGTGANSYSNMTRSFFLFNTAPIPDSATISAATLSLYGTAVSDSGGITPDINIYASTPASNTAIAAADYQNVGTTVFSTAITYAGWSTAGYNAFALNASGLAAITATGVSKFSARNASYDVANTDPGVSTTSYIQGYYADQADTTYDPKLAITYSAGLSVAGTFFDTDESSTLKSKSLGLRVNGGAEATATSDAGDGTFIFSNVAANAGDTITIYSKDATSKANTITITDGSTNITGAHLYASHVAVSSHNGATAITNADIADWDNDDDAANMLFTDNASALVMEAGNEFYIFASKTYTPGGTVTVEDIDINGTFVPSSNSVTVSGSWDSTEGTLTNTSSTVTFTSTTAETITSDTEVFNNLTFNGATGVWTAQDVLVTAASSALTITNGTLDIANQDFTIGAGGTFTNNGTLKLVGGTQTLTNLTIPTTAGTTEYSGTGSYTGLKAANSYYNLKINGAGGTYTLDAATDINGDITLTAGTLAADIQNMTVYGDWTVSSGLFNPGSSTVTFNGGETGGTITSNGQSFNNLAVAGIFPNFTDDFTDLDSNLWVDYDAASPVSISSGRVLAYEATGIAYHKSGLNSLGKWLLQGDFDIQVDFDATEMPASGAAYLAFKANGLFYTISTDGDSYWSDQEMSGTAAVSNHTGKLRLVRSGTDVYGYYWNGSSWVQYSSASGAAAQDATALFLAGNVAGGVHAKAYFDNFVVNSGTLSGTPYASWTLQDDLTVSNTLTMTSGTLTAGANTITTKDFTESGGTFSAPTSADALNVSGNFTRSAGTFTAPALSTVNLTGAGGSTQIMSGDTTFVNLSATAGASARVLQFAGNSITTVSGTWTITGASLKLITLQSSDANNWTITPMAAVVSYANVARSTSNLAICATYSTDGLNNNANWSFSAGDSCGGGTIQFTLTSSNGSEATTPANLEVSLGETQLTDASVDYAVTGGTATGGGVDYTLASGTATITAGATTTNISPVIVNDTLDENNETIEVTISNPSSATLGANTIHTYTINDDDASPTIQFTATSSNGAESVTPANLEVSIDAVSGKNTSVDYAVTGGTATGGGTDYTLEVDTATITAGNTTINISPAITNDTLDENNETIEVIIWNPSNATLGANTIHTYTINDDDNPPTVAFTSASSNGSEATTPADMEVSLSSTSAKTITVDYAVTGGTATGGGVDYTLASGTLTFNPGDTAKNVSATIVDDALDENNETIIVTLSNPTNASLGVNTAQTYTINDNDAAPTIQFTATSSNGSEATTPVNLEVSIDAVSGLNTSVDYAVTGGTATGGGTDYTLASGTATITAGNLTTNISIVIVNDTMDESDETIEVTISNPTNATLGANSVYTYTINDNDNAPTVTLSANAANIAEAGGVATVIATLSNTSASTVTTNLVFAGTATNLVDYNRSGDSIAIASGSSAGSITVSGIDDVLIEGDETVIIDIDSVTNGTENGAQQVTITIADDDSAPAPGGGSSTYYTITATAGVGGTISPSGSVPVKKIHGQTFVITPDEGYHIADVLVDGSSIGAASVYNFIALTANHTITASFAPNVSLSMTTDEIATGTGENPAEDQIIDNQNQGQASAEIAPPAETVNQENQPTAIPANQTKASLWSKIVGAFTKNTAAQISALIILLIAIIIGWFIYRAKKAKNSTHI